MEQLIHIRAPKRQRKALQTPNPEVRERLMQAAGKLLNEGGYAALRIEDIAEQAGLSVGTFYLYFEGKPDLFVKLVEEHTERLRDRLNEAAAEGTSPADGLSRSVDAYLDFVLENERSFLHFVRASGSLQTNHGTLSTWALDRHSADLQPGLHEALERREVRRLNPVLAGHAMIALTQSIAVFWLEHRDTCTREELKHFLLSFIGYGILRRPPVMNADGREPAKEVGGRT